MPDMLRYTEHAQNRLQQRSISKRLVELTLNSPDFILPTRSGREIAIKVHGKRFLKVIFKKENATIIVITVHWISKFKVEN